MSMTTRNITMDHPPKPDASILSLVTVSGNSVVFLPSDPGRVLGDLIKGTAITGIEERIPAPPLSVKRRPDGRVYEIIDRAGRAHPVFRVLQEGETEWTVVRSGSEPRRVFIPLSEVKQVSYKTRNVPMTYLVAPAMVVAALFCLLFGIYGHPWGWR